jgi:predicted kinase
MEIGWSSVKEIFFAIGSMAGVLAFLRPLVEAKLQRDNVRVDRIKAMLSEQRLVDLEHRIWDAREVASEDFEPFDQLAHERHTNQQVVRFTGPTGKYLARD